MKDLRTAFDYRVLREVRLQIKRSQGFLLVYFFSDDTLFLQWLKHEIDSLLRAQSRSLITRNCDTQDALKQALETLLLPSPGAETCAVWVDAAQTLGDALLARLNERRSQLVANQRPVFLCLPQGQALHCATLAPDLWSIRSSVYEVEAALGSRSLHTDAPKIETQAAGATVHALSDYVSLWRDAWLKQQASQGQSQASSDLGILAIEQLLQQHQTAQAQIVLEQVASNAAKTDDPNEPNSIQGWLAQFRGEIDEQRGQLSAARSHYEKSLAIREQLRQLTRDAPEALRDLSVSLNKVAGIDEKLGRLDAARSYCEKSLEICEQLRELTGDTPQALRDLSVSLDNVAGIDEKLGRLEAARSHYARSLAIREQLRQLTADAPEALRDLSVSLEKVAGIDEKLGRLEAARSNYAKSLAICEQLRELTGDTPQALRDLSVSLEKVAGIDEKLGKLDAARSQYEKSLVIREQLRQLTGDTPQALRDLSVSLERVAGIDEKLGRLDAARNHYEQSLKLSEQLCQLTGDAPDALCDLAISYERLGFLEFKLNNFSAAQAWFEKVLALGQRLLILSADHEAFKSVVRTTQHYLDAIQQAAQK